MKTIGRLIHQQDSVTQIGQRGLARPAGAEDRANGPGRKSQI
jgi:hypothetical protein